MYRFLVVEDDNNIRKGLIKIITKMELPIENIYEAENGEDAINSTLKYNPHIIITDIKMPFISGLDFIEHIKKNGCNAKFVILSGYSEFSYAQRAISCNVSEYLLKPVKKDNLYNTLIKLIEQLKQEEEVILKPVLNTYYEEILNAINNKNFQEVYISIDNLFDFLIKLNPVTPELIKNSIENFIHYYLPPDKKGLLINNMNTEEFYQNSHTLADFRFNVKNMLYNVCKYENVYYTKRYTNKISNAIKYIEMNYINDLHLEEVAKYINLNTSYFSNTFKKQTGMHFSDFLQKIRVEKSKSLLIQPQYKIYEIAEKVGFMDEKYYFKIFKKLTGITPTQYRNGVFSNKEDIF